MNGADSPKAQSRSWSRHAAHYQEVLLDPFRPGVENPILPVLEAAAGPTKSAIDLGCGTGPLLPWLLPRFGSVAALDFAPGMIDHAKSRLGKDAERVRFEVRPMYELDDFQGAVDAAAAVNSLVMPDTRDIDRTLAAVRACLRPGGVFVGVVPSIDAIHYHTMLLMDRALDRGLAPEAAERVAALHAEHAFYEFAFGRFKFQGLRQKFWQPFELEYRLRKAGFSQVRLVKLLYPWDDHVLPQGEQYADEPRSWDWSFEARP